MSGRGLAPLTLAVIVSAAAPSPASALIQHLQHRVGVMGGSTSLGGPAARPALIGGPSKSVFHAPAGRALGPSAPGVFAPKARIATKPAAPLRLAVLKAPHAPAPRLKAR